MGFLDLAKRYTAEGPVAVEPAVSIVPVIPSAPEGPCLACNTPAEAATEIPPEPVPVSRRRAVLLHSRRLGCEVWVLREPADVDLIHDEVGDRPVFLASELPALRGLDDATLRAVVDAKVAMPGTRVVTDSGEPFTPARTVFPTTGSKTATT